MPRVGDTKCRGLSQTTRRRVRRQALPLIPTCASYIEGSRILSIRSALRAARKVVAFSLIRPSWGRIIAGCTLKRSGPIKLHSAVARDSIAWAPGAKSSKQGVDRSARNQLPLPLYYTVDDRRNSATDICLPVSETCSTVNYRSWTVAGPIQAPVVLNDQCYYTLNTVQG